MNRSEFDLRLQRLVREHEAFLSRKNEKKVDYNGLYDRYKYPVLTAGHAPLFWRFDMNYDSNPLLLQRMGINATFNAGAMEFGGKIVMMVRVEGWDRKSFFAIAESDNGIDNFRFRDYPVDHARNRTTRRQCVRHAACKTRGWMDLRSVLHRTKGCHSYSIGPVIRRSPVRRCANTRPRDLGAPSRPRTHRVRNSAIAYFTRNL
jgi:hypothetical protein